MLLVILGGGLWRRGWHCFMCTWQGECEGKCWPFDPMVFWMLNIKNNTSMYSLCHWEKLHSQVHTKIMSVAKASPLHTANLTAQSDFCHLTHPHTPSAHHQEPGNDILYIHSLLTADSHFIYFPSFFPTKARAFLIIIIVFVLVRKTVAQPTSVPIFLCLVCRMPPQHGLMSDV